MSPKSQPQGGSPLAAVSGQHSNPTPVAFLWIIDLPYRSRFHNGGLVRYLNLSRELLARGHTVTFAVVVEDDREPAMEWMRSLQRDGAFTDVCELMVDGPSWNRLATLLLPFSLHGYAIRDFRAKAVAAITELARSHPADVLLCSSSRYIYMAHEFRGCPRIGDFCDSYTLFLWRDARVILQRRQYRAAASRYASLLIWFFRELYVCRKYDANIFVSPVDKRVFDVLGRQPEKDRLLSNGVRFSGSAAPVAKIPHQIIFSGAMNFPPNCDGALWFLDQVFPSVLRSIPDAVFVIAGGKPDPRLLARAGPHVRVPGFVDDLNRAIAESALYVAPMRSGSGFKNKVAEALAGGTWVIGTSLAVEFLEPELRDLITVQDDPAAMAEEICRFFADPAAWNTRLERSRQILSERFSWPAKAKELERIVDSILPRNNPQ